MGGFSVKINLLGEKKITIKTAIIYPLPILEIFFLYLIMF